MINDKENKTIHQEVVGLLPAGGRARRIAPLPCSKELFPVGFRNMDEGRSLRPKVVCHYLLEKMRLAGITKAYIVLRKGKWDIPAYFGDGSMLNMHLAYLMMRSPLGVPYTVDQAYPFLQDNLVAFGFPDIIFQPDDAFVQLLSRQQATSADIVLALFSAHRPQETEMIDVADDGRVRSLIIKPSQTHLRYNWIFALWTPGFTHFMHEHLADLQNKQREAQNPAPEHRELSIGHVIQAAIDQELKVEAVIFPNNTFLDIGTPDDLVNAIRNIK